MNLTVLSYLLYLLVAVPVTVWVARVLGQNGKLFLVDVFDGRTDLAEAVNRLLVVGFYLLNLGFVALYLRVDSEILSGREVLESLSVKLGVVLLVLGVVHLLNVWVFNRIRRRSRQDQMRIAPLAPHDRIPPFPA